MIKPHCDLVSVEKKTCFLIFLWKTGQSKQIPEQTGQHDHEWKTPLPPAQVCIAGVGTQQGGKSGLGTIATGCAPSGSWTMVKLRCYMLLPNLTHTCHVFLHQEERNWVTHVIHLWTQTQEKEKCGRSSHFSARHVLLYFQMWEENTTRNKIIRWTEINHKADKGERSWGEW
jgi:hypothetical protein